MNPNHRLAIDWFQTIRLKKNVPYSHVQALHRLQRAGYELILLSFCGREREKQVREEAATLGVNFSMMKFVTSKTGSNGKVAWCRRLSCGYLFDDDDNILWEAEQEAFPYYAIQTSNNPHGWCNNTYRNLPQAVEAFLSNST